MPGHFLLSASCRLDRSNSNRTSYGTDCVSLCFALVCVYLRWGRWWDGAQGPVGIQRQTDVYLPSPYSSTGTLMTPALVYIRLLDSRVQYPRLDNIVFPLADDALQK